MGKKPVSGSGLSFFNSIGRKYSCGALLNTKSGKEMDICSTELHCRSPTQLSITMILYLLMTGAGAQAATGTDLGSPSCQWRTCGAFGNSDAIKAEHNVIHLSYCNEQKGHDCPTAAVVQYPALSFLFSKTGQKASSSPARALRFFLGFFAIHNLRASQGTAALSRGPRHEFFSFNFNLPTPAALM